VLPENEKKPANVFLPFTRDGSVELCWELDYVCVACDETYTCLTGFRDRNELLLLDYLAAEVCFKRNSGPRDRAASYHAITRLSSFTLGFATLIVRLEHVYLGCPSLRC